MQNVSQRCRIKVAKCHFIILLRFGVIEEKPQGGGGQIPPPSPQVWIGLRYLFFNEGILKFSNWCLKMMKNGIFILVSMKLLKCFYRLIRPKLDWLNQRCLRVFISFNFVVSNYCKLLRPHCKHLPSQTILF